MGPLTAAGVLSGRALPRATLARSPLPLARRAVTSCAAGVPLTGPGRDDEPVRIYRYVVDSHGQLFLHDTPVKNIATCYKDLTFLDFFMPRVEPNSHPEATLSEIQTVINGSDASQGNEDVRIGSGHADIPAWDALDWPERLLVHAHGVSAPKAQAERLAARMARRAGYTFFSPCMGELNFIRPVEADGTAVVYRDLVPTPARQKNKQSQKDDGPDLALLWAGRRLEPFNPAKLTLNLQTGRMYHPSPRPLARAGVPVCALSDSLVLCHFADQLELVEDDRKGSSDSAPIVARLHWRGKAHPLFPSENPA